MRPKRVIIRIIIFLCLVIALDQVLGAFLEVLDRKFLPDYYPRVMMREFYGLKSNIDLAFMGSSHAYRGFDPVIFDEALRVNSFNLGSSGQNPTITYYILEELLRIGHKPRLMVIEAYWMALSGGKTDYRSASYVFHNMKFSANKLSMFRSAFEFPSSLKLLSRAFQYRRVVMHLPSTLMRKILSRTKSPHSERYAGKGYVEDPSVVSESELANNQFKNESYRLNEYRLRFLRKMIDLAKKRGIEVVLVTTPVAPTAFKDVQGYQEIYGIIRGIAGEREVEYVDYNILNSELKIFSDRNFRDDDHLNKGGVKIFGEHFTQRLVDIYGPHLQSLD